MQLVYRISLALQPVKYDANMARPGKSSVTTEVTSMAQSARSGHEFPSSSMRGKCDLTVALCTQLSRAQFVIVGLFPMISEVIIKKS